jgi:hypothetical protein
MTCKRKIKYGYAIFWYDMFRPSSLKDALEMVQSILPDLRKLAQWENEGKVQAESMGCSPLGIQGIEVLDKSIEPQLRKLKLLVYFDNDEEEAEV